MPKRVLIIHEEFGTGHTQAAKVIEDMLCVDPDVEVMIRRSVDIVPDPIATAAVWLWGWMLSHNMVRLADWGLIFALRIVGFPLVELLSMPDFLKGTAALKPDAIIVTSDGAARIFGGYARLHRLPFVLVLTETSLTFDYYHPDATHLCLFKETRDVVRRFPDDVAYYTASVEGGFFRRLWTATRFCLDFVRALWDRWLYYDVFPKAPARNEARTVYCGPIVHEKNFTPVDRSEARQQLDIPLDRACVLVAAGGIGGTFCVETAKTVCRDAQRDLTLLVATGRDERSLEELQAYTSDNPRVEIRPFGFVDNFQNYLRAADVLISRPTATVFLESLVAGTPVMFPPRCTSNDHGIVVLVEHFKLGEIYKNKRDIWASAERILDDLPAYRQRVSDYLADRPSYEETGETIRELVLGSPAGGTDASAGIAAPTPTD